MVAVKRKRDWSGWVWPVPDTDAGPAVISQEFRGKGDARPHLGVDIMYGRPGAWFAPSLSRVLAAAAGRVWSVAQTARGWHVVVDHGQLASFYQHLETKPEVEAGDHVEAGQPLGVMGADPTDPQGLRHLHFEVWAGAPDAAIDVGPAMLTWPRSRAS